MVETANVMSTSTNESLSPIVHDCEYTKKHYFVPFCLLFVNYLYHVFLYVM